MRRKKPNKIKDKSDAQRAHCKQRFLERYGIEFNRHMRREFVRLIQYNQCHLVKKQTCRTSVWDVIYEGRVFRVVYDKNRKNIVTVLPDPKAQVAQRQEAVASKAIC